MDFNVKLTLPILGADSGWKAYQLQHGIIIVYFDNVSKVNKMQISSRTPETIRVCE
jgi:hypothetical protein